MDTTDVTGENNQGDGMDDVVDGNGQDAQYYPCAYCSTEDGIMTLVFRADFFAAYLKGKVLGSGDEKRIEVCSSDTPMANKAQNGESCLVETYKLRTDLEGETCYVRLGVGVTSSTSYFFTTQAQYEDYLKSLVDGNEWDKNMPELYNPRGDLVTRDPLRDSIKPRRTGLSDVAFAYRLYWNAAIDGRRGLGSAAGRTWDLPLVVANELIEIGKSVTLYICGSKDVDAKNLCYVADCLKGIKKRRFNPKFGDILQKDTEKMKLWSENLFGFYSIWVDEESYEKLLQLQELEREYARFPDLKRIELVHDKLSDHMESEKKKGVIPKPLPLVVNGELDRAEEFDTITCFKASDMKAQIPRTGNAQKDVMGISAPDVGNAIWPDLKKIEYEWAHRSAHSFGDLFQPKGQAQVNRNLVLGTKSANSLMCRYEASIRRLAKTEKSEIMLMTTIPNNPGGINENSAALQEYGVVCQEDADAFKATMSKNYTWFCPILQYEVQCTNSSNERARQVAGRRWIPMFRLRKVLVWETSLDRIVEDSHFKGTSLEVSASVPANTAGLYNPLDSFQLPLGRSLFDHKDSKMEEEK